MNILPYKLTTTNDQLSSRAGLLAIAQLIQTLQLTKRIDQQFPLPGSNRGFLPSVFIETLILMQHEGSFHLDEVRHLHEENALLSLLGIDQIPTARAIGEWLRRMGNKAAALEGWKGVNQAILKTALHNKKGVTLDIDATKVIAGKSDAKWTYKKHQGYMPMVGHIAETGQIAACDFREGNASPSRENLEFIKQCEHALPEGITVKWLRIDAAGYQSRIIEYCDQNNIQYAIRARMSATIKAQIEAMEESDWKPLLNRDGEEISDQQSCRIPHWIGDYEAPFTLIIQRKRIKGQMELGLGSDDHAEQMSDSQYQYRAIATNRETLSDSELVHWYNQRGEDSENRIKELKHDFGADTLPCSDFQANALYFHICALSYNLFALMRQLLSEYLAHHRAMTLRWRLYWIAAKIVKTGRQLYVKTKQKHQQLLRQVLGALRQIDPPPI
ncbi:IS1380 family transposase [Thiolapillus sp.]